MLNVTLLCVGRTKAGLERDLAARYVERARLAGRGLGLAIDLLEIGESRARRPLDRKAEEATAILATTAGAGTIVAFDETGRSVESEAFARLLGAGLEDGTRALTLVIGGPDGLDPKIRAAARHVIALGSMTWPHQLARVMVAEQVYRAVTILLGHPYHRA